MVLARVRAGRKKDMSTIISGSACTSSAEILAPITALALALPPRTVPAQAAHVGVRIPSLRNGVVTSVDRFSLGEACLFATQRTLLWENVADDLFRKLVLAARKNGGQWNSCEWVFPDGVSCEKVRQVAVKNGLRIRTSPWELRIVELPGGMW